MKPARNKTWHARTLDQETETKQKNIRLRSRIMRRACSVCLHTTGMDDRTKTIKINDRNDDLLTTIIPTFLFWPAPREKSCPRPARWPTAYRRFSQAGPRANNDRHVLRACVWPWLGAHLSPRYAPTHPVLLYPVKLTICTH